MGNVNIVSGEFTPRLEIKQLVHGLSIVAVEFQCACQEVHAIEILNFCVIDVNGGGLVAAFDYRLNACDVDIVEGNIDAQFHECI